jgi:hypothetical protein
VVWPYKDLRLANGLKVPVRFSFAVEAAAISVAVHAPVRLAPARIEINRVDQEGRRDVQVFRQRGGGILESVSTDRYVAPPA